MNRPIKVMSVGTAILGSAVYHANVCASLEKSSVVQLIRRSVAEYWDVWAKVLFATIGSSRWSPGTYRYRAEWAMSEIARRGIQREIKQLQPDVIHCHTQSHALRCHRIAGRVPLVVTMDTTSRQLCGMPGYASRLGALEKVVALETRVFAASAAVGGVSRWVTRSLEQDYPLARDRVHLCSPCVDTDFFTPALRPEKAAEADKMRIVFVGNDLERKGGRLLLELMAEGLAAVAELHIVSGAEAPADLPRGVTWHRGLKPGSAALLEQLQRADVFALPTYEDCFPQALIEAMACGLPLVSSNVMGVPELAQNDVNGFCLEPGDKTALAGALRTLAQSPELRRRFAAASRAMAGERFSPSVSRRTWEAVFTQAAAAARPTARN